jgi:DNA transformation protein
MGKKGDKLTSAATQAAEEICRRLADLGDVASRKMFGGHGVFESGKMFALVDSAGHVFLKVDAGTSGKFEALGASRHGKMPYFEVPRQILDDREALNEWARESIAIAHRA